MVEVLAVSSSEPPSQSTELTGSFVPSPALPDGAEIGLRNIEFYRPKYEALPWELLAAGSARYDLAAMQEHLELDYTRVVSLLEEPVLLGIYAMRERPNNQFELLSVGVFADFEHRLLGRRLLGHALGLAESKSGQSVELAVCAENRRALSIVSRYGFVLDEPANGVVSCRFELTPE